MPSASAPWVLPFAGRLWPCGPERIEVRVELAAGGWRSRVHDPGLGLTLWVDPDLPAPSGDEGPLGCEASALRAAAPPRPVEVSSRGPRPPLPGADAARAAALRAALEAAFPGAPGGGSPAASPLERCLQQGRPCPPEPGAVGEPAPSPELLALLDERLVLHQDLVSRLRGEPPAPHEPLVPLERLPAWLDEARGRGLGAPTRSPRARDLEAELRAAGLCARWPLGEGLVLVLCEPGARARLVLALEERGLHPHPCQLGGARGVSLAAPGEEAA